MSEEMRVLLDAEDRDITAIIESLPKAMDDYPPDMIIVDEGDLDELVAAFGGPKAKPSETTVFTEDAYTRGFLEFNLIAFGHEDPHLDEDEYGMVTQLGTPTQHADTVIDLRADRGGFSDVMQGLGGGPEED